ncbi:NAD(P)-dependent oxidoreductase [Actinomadura atramentaria]|uniref:NAD(P)-dependent oxidoreductase n=1 Tax=Actinomadura atramentaria TaxID=1990 RepID=UPI000379DB34|nr:NAD(P)H-binding protein [Actinomadura atramentaria]
MSRIAIFGAGGRAGRRAVLEAAARGHRVTAVVRNPDAHRDLAGADVAVVAGDVTSAADVAAAAAGHDAAITTAARLDVPAVEFFPAAARALLDGLARAGTARLVLTGIGTTLETSPGVPLHDTPGFPEDARAFSLGHSAELDVLRAADTSVDWLVLAPPPVVLNDGERTGRHRIGGTALIPADAFSYADLAAALVDEAAQPKHHRTLAAVAY